MLSYWANDMGGLSSFAPGPFPAEVAEEDADDEIERSRNPERCGAPSPSEIVRLVEHSCRYSEADVRVYYAGPARNPQRNL